MRLSELDEPSIAAMTEYSEETLEQFLADPDSYPHGPDQVRIVQTHASYVAIASPFVFKVKKAVDFGFLDFSTLEKRKHFCELEVELNRRLCSGTYLGVVQIGKQEGRLSLEGEGQVVEYAVKMRELDPEGFLDHLLEEERVGSEQIDRVVKKLVAFYRDQVSTPQIAEWGRVERLKISTDENFEQTAPFVGKVVPEVSYDAIERYTNRFFEEEAALFARRREEGRILDCHGDLHTEHVHLGDQQVCIYDCIEFSERFRCIDVANDIAFLSMDLDFNGFRPLAHYLTGQTADALGDEEMERLVPFYSCYRAFVRGKVEIMRSERNEVSTDDRSSSVERARRYFQLALDYAMTGGEPFVLVIMGGVGTGKSTVAEAMKAHLGWEVVSSDRCRKQIAGVPLHERGDEEARERLYAQEMTQKTYAMLQERALERARKGYSTILDATYGRRAHRANLVDALEGDSVPCLFVELEAPRELVAERLRAREKASRAEAPVSDARLEDLDMLKARYEAPAEDEPGRSVRVSTQHEPERNVEAVLKELEGTR